ncbi:Stk1 family PASTA domain-containing Ser/Thr kinase [Dolosicoccus paucivorans]
MDIGDKLSDRYVIKDVIGQGGMANVFLGHDLILNRDVAIKVLRFDFQDNKDAIRRFRREAMSASQLLHHNIVEVYDVDEEDGKQYIVMEYVKGEDLKTYIRKHSPLPLESVVSIMMQLLLAIDLAHKHQIIHRDIKPQNVLIKDGSEVKITDFGIAIALTDTSITQTNTLLGSVHYLSPEQARGANATVKSDIYALGIVLYELITGTVPFDGESPVSIALKHFQEDLPSVREQYDYIPQSLENVILKATAKNPEDRYASVQEMLADLSTSLNESRFNEPMFIPPSKLEETIAIKPIKALSASSSSLDQATSKGPEPLDEEVFPRFDEVAPIEPAKRTNWWLKYLLPFILMVALIAGGFGAYNFFYLNTTMPDIEGLTQEEAQEALSRAHLTLGEVQKVWNETVKAGEIVDTKPTAGTRLKRNSTVDIIMSNGKEQVQIGDYIGMEYEEIRRRLTEANFIVQRRDLATTPDQAGIILDQDIQPGSQVIPSETPITLTVGNAPESVTMQDFYNLSEEVVHNFEAGFGINVEYEYDYDEFIPVGQVISQEPESGTHLEPGDTISVVISKGPREEHIVPQQVNIDIEYLSKYDDKDVDKEDPLPNVIRVYIGDVNNDINQIAEEFEIKESRTIQIFMYIKEHGTGQYRVTRDDEVIAENGQVYPQ